MSNLELLISRYLDGELTPTEVRKLHQRLEESPEARALLREMTLVGRSARRIPTLDTPSPSLEARLFHRLHAEGLAPTLHPQSTAGSTAAAMRSFSRPVVALLLMVFFAMTSSYWLADQSQPTAIVGVADRATRPAPVSDGAPGAPAPTPDASSSIASTVDEAPRSTPRRPAVRHGASSRNLPARQQPAPMEVVPFAEVPRQLPVREETLDTSADRLAVVTPPAPTPQQVQHDILPEPFPSLERPVPGREGILAASFRPAGRSYMTDGRSAPELSVRLDAQLGKGHQVSLIVGRSPLRSEQSAVALVAMSPASATDEGAPSRSFGASNQSAPESSTIELEEETWGGIGYSYQLAEIGPVQLGVGGRVGVGSKSMRYGAEFSGRFNISKVIAFEAVPSFSRIIPHDQSATPQMLEDASTGTLSFGETKHSSFYSAGLELGVRIAIR